MNKVKHRFNILIAEDNVDLNQQLTELLVNAGYQVQAVFNGNEALLTISKSNFELILLDVMMPEVDGFSALNAIRKISQVPVIMVTAKGAEEERITGLLQGADDYVTKPFNPQELLLRIEALLRRSQPNKAPQHHKIYIDELLLDRQKQSVTVEDELLELTNIQFKILWQLALHRGQVLSKAFLSQQALNRTLGAYDRGLDMHLSRIRRKLNSIGWQGDRLQTVHGKGYCLK